MTSQDHPIHQFVVSILDGKTRRGVDVHGIARAVTQEAARYFAADHAQRLESLFFDEIEPT
jgi:hypothetical protein